MKSPFPAGRAWACAGCALVLLSLAACGPSGPGGSAQAEGAKPHTPEARAQAAVARFANPERDFWQRPAWLLAQMGPLQGKTVADIGAGQGYFALPLALLADKVIAIDVDSGFVPYLMDQRAVHKLPNLEIRLTTPNKPALATHEAHLVWVANTFSYIRNREAYFAEVRNAIKPGGTLWVVDWLRGGVGPAQPDGGWVPPHQVQAELQAAGFQVFRWDSTSLQYQYVLRAQ